MIPLAKHLLDIEKGIEKQHNLEIIVQMVREDKVDTEGIIRAVEESAEHKQSMYNLLASTFYNNDLFESIVPLLDASLRIDNKHVDTLFNFAFILYKVGANQQALFFLNQIEEKDEDAIQLMNDIRAKSE